LLGAPNQKINTFLKRYIMEHFWKSVGGWFDDLDAQFYQSVVDKASSEHLHFVEVGTWKGRSAAYMMVAVINAGKNIRFDCVDTWLGAPEHREGSTIADGVFVDEDVVKGRLFAVFTENMKPLEGHYRAVRMESAAAAATYEDNSLDFVFIDADHTYESITQDIKSWLPKVKFGGIISGHDYWYPPVHRAVHELLSDISSMGACWSTTKKP